MSRAEQPASPSPSPTASPTPTVSPAVSPSPAVSAPATIRARFESKFPRGLIIRLIAYLFVGHLFAFFVYLLFVLGGQNQ
ncbi:DUF6126 family protein [Streptomyces sp. NPDC054840]